MFAVLGILEKCQSSLWQHCSIQKAKLTEIKELHVSMSRNLGRAVSRITRHQIPSQARIDVDESSHRVFRLRLAVDPRPCGVMDAQDVNFLLLVTLHGSNFDEVKSVLT